jgi:hypothetical protein
MNLNTGAKIIISRQNYMIIFNYASNLRPFLLLLQNMLPDYPPQPPEREVSAVSLLIYAAAKSPSRDLGVKKRVFIYYFYLCSGKQRK